MPLNIAHLEPASLPLTIGYVDLASYLRRVRQLLEEGPHTRGRPSGMAFVLMRCALPYGVARGDHLVNREYEALVVPAATRRPHLLWACTGVLTPTELAAIQTQTNAGYLFDDATAPWLGAKQRSAYVRKLARVSSLLSSAFTS